MEKMCMCYILATVHLLYGVMVVFRRRRVIGSKHVGLPKSVLGVTAFCVVGFLAGAAWDSLIEFRGWQGITRWGFVGAVLIFHLVALGIVWEFMRGGSAVTPEAACCEGGSWVSRLRLSQKCVMYCLSEVILTQVIGLMLWLA